MHIPTKSIFSRAHVRDDEVIYNPRKKVAETESRISSVNVEYICCTVRFFTCKKRPVLKDRAKSKSQKLVNICDDEYKINKLQLDYRDSFWVPRWLGGQSRDSLCLRKGASQEHTIRYEILF